MPKVDVLIVDKPTKKVLAVWKSVSSKRAGRIARKWRRMKIKETSVCVFSRASLLRRLH
jgi:hypothetical protein